MIKKIKNALVRKGRFLCAHPIVECALLSVLMDLLLEVLSRHSLLQALSFAFFSFPFFLVGCVSVGLIFSIALFFKRRYFVYAVCASLLLIVGITQAVLMSIRAEPFAAVDFVILLSAFRLIPQYIGVLGIVLSVLAILGAAALAVVIFRRSKKRKPSLKKSVAFTSFLALALVVFHLATLGGGRFGIQYSDAADAYEKYGFFYCFTRSFFDYGVDEPKTYGFDAVNDLTSLLSQEKDNAPVVNGKSPNVVFLQLESFIDPKYIKELSLSCDPVPSFTGMKENGPSGLLKVNTIGGGTANTEFQVLCGMDLAHFGIVEYPYSTVLDDTAAPSLATVFSELGYSCTALHNHTATFYGRHNVYANLGFDAFVPVEYMKNVEYNSIGWEKDSVLTEEILNVLTSTSASDFVFAVSVEGHGNYPDYPLFDPLFPVEGERYSHMRHSLEYYLDTVNSMDTFLGELIDALSECGEDVILVAYGDHLPSMELTEDDVFLPDLYSTEYAVWSSFELPGGWTDRDLDSNELSTALLSALSLRGNAINRLRSERSSREGFQNELQLLEFDALYGDSFAFSNKTPRMSFGVDVITISSVELAKNGDGVFQKNTLTVYGDNFTPFSTLFVNGVRCDSRFVDENTIVCDAVPSRDSYEIFVAQISDSVTMLGKTDIFTLDG